MGKKSASGFNRRMTPEEKEAIRQKATPSEKLFRWKWKVAVPAAYLYTEEDFAKGVPVTGDKRRDTQSAMESVMTYFAIAPDDDCPQPTILTYHEQEVPGFRIVNEEDYATIYKIISSHLINQAEYLNNSPLINPERRRRIVEDCARLDRLAAYLHPVAQSLLPKHLAVDSIENKLRLLAPILAGPSTVEKTTPETPKYRQFGESLNSTVMKRTKRWLS